MKLCDVTAPKQKNIGKQQLPLKKLFHSKFFLLLEVLFVFLLQEESKDGNLFVLMFYFCRHGVPENLL